MVDIAQFELTKEFLEAFQAAVAARDDKWIITSLDGINPADISALLDEFDAEDCKYVFELLDDKVGAEILRDLDEDVKELFLAEFTAEEIARYVENLDSDDGVDVFFFLLPPPSLSLYSSSSLMEYKEE
ncbi:MAG: hypothetical protein AAFO69_21175, partial [Bacteroidota bacterium]